MTTSGTGLKEPSVSSHPAGLTGQVSSRDLALRSAEFRKGREQGWRQLDELIVRIEKNGIRSLSVEEIERLPLLYRATLSSLSVARTIVLDRNLLLYLEDLSLRAYLVVYGPCTGIMQNLKHFLLKGFPRAVYGMRLHLAVAFVLFMIGVAAGYFLVSADMSYYSILMPESLAAGRGPLSTAQELRDDGLFQPWQGFTETFIVFANSLFRHNAMVGILCFGLGFAFGIPTMFLLIYNGLVIGAFIALHAAHGLATDCIGWLMIHGVTEILAVLLCGTAGLVIAEKILFPGQLSRLESLARSGRTAAIAVAGAILMLFLAGIIEGGFRQLIDNTAGRYAFAAATALFWFWYFHSGKKETINGS